MIAIAAATALLLVSCLAAFPAAVAAETNSYSVSFDGSVQYLAPNETGTVLVHVSTDRPAGNYTWNASMSAGSVTPSKGTTDAESLTLKVTAGTTTGDAVLSVGLTNGTVSQTVKYTVHVISPVVITADVRNNGNVTLTSVPVQFMADGTVINTTTFTIPANSTKTLTYNWTAGGLSDGDHTLQIVLDPNSQYVSFLDGSTTFSSTFHKGGTLFGMLNILLVIIAVLLMVVIFFTYMNRGKKRKK
ncbi:MAG: CARDB domain-containing protein [Methanomassiliicoccus sp.]|nr:CARDB domain-containing protein [Methanomassiliicoccus sp.]